MGCEYEKNFCFNFGNCAVCIICRSTIHIMPIGLCRSGGRIYDNSKQFMSHRIHIRRHGGQLFGIQSIRFMHNVCANRCQLYGCIRYIRIYVRMPVGMTAVIPHLCHCEGGRTPDRGNLLLSLRAKRSNPVNINLFASANAFLWIATPLTWLAMTRTVDCTQTRVTFSVICTLTKTGRCPVFYPTNFCQMVLCLDGCFLRLR